MEPLLIEPAGPTQQSFETGIVVCTHDRPRYLRRCLASLQRSHFDEAVIVLVDDASTDSRSQRLIRDFELPGNAGSQAPETRGRGLRRCRQSSTRMGSLARPLRLHTADEPRLGCRRSAAPLVGQPQEPLQRPAPEPRAADRDGIQLSHACRHRRRSRLSREEQPRGRESVLRCRTLLPTRSPESCQRSKNGGRMGLVRGRGRDCPGHPLALHDALSHPAHRAARAVLEQRGRSRCRTRLLGRLSLAYRRRPALLPGRRQP